MYMFIIDFSKNHKTAKISNLSQPLFDKQPISSTKLQQSFVYVCHWFQQKQQNNEKTQLVKGLHPIGWDGMASIRCGGEAVWKEQSSVGIYPKDKYRGEYDDAQLIV